MIQFSQEVLAKMPKKPLNPYMMFRKEMYPEISKMNPHNTMTEISQMIADIWHEMTQEERIIYQNKSLLAHTIYLDEYKKWQQEFDITDEDVKQYRKVKNITKQNQRIQRQKKQKTKELIKKEQKQQEEENDLEDEEQKILGLNQQMSMLKLKINNETQEKNSYLQK